MFTCFLQTIFLSKGRKNLRTIFNDFISKIRRKWLHNYFDDYDSMSDLLKQIGLSVACRVRLMDEEGLETARDLSGSRLEDIQTTVETVNKMFGARNNRTKVYFPPVKIV